MPHYPALTADSYRIYAESGLGWTYEYGAALWVMFLDEKLGTGDGGGGVELWEAAANEGWGFEPDVVDAFAAVAGMPLGEAMAELAVIRFLTGADWDERGLLDAASWGDAEAVPADPLGAEALPFSAAPSEPPMTLGQAFLDLDLIGAPPRADEVVIASVGSATGIESSLALLWWTDDGTAAHAVAWGSAPRVQIPAAGVARVVAAVTNLGPAGWDGDSDAYVRGDHVVSLSVEPEPTATPPPTDTGTDPAPPPGGPDDPSAGGGELAGSTICGCGSGTRGGASAWWAAILLAVRRRSRR